MRTPTKSQEQKITLRIKIKELWNKGFKAT